MNAVPFFALAKAKQAHQHLREHGQIPAGMIPPTIAQSWQRCSEKGLPSKGVDFSPCQATELRTELEKHAVLLDHATPVMEMLHQQIIDSHSMVVLTNADGFILHSFGDDAFLERANRVSLKPGVNWAEDDKGTNAIGTALIEERPISIHGHQHYFSTNHFITCSASPILNPFGKVVGVLDVTGDHRSYSPHTLALVKMSVRLVENQMFAHAFPDAIVIHFHTRPEYLGTICEGMIAFSPDGQTLAANQNAYNLLGLRPRDVAGSCFEQIFNQSIKTAVEHTLHHSKLPLQLTNTRGVKMYCRGVAGSTMRSPLRVFTFPRAEETVAPSPAAPAAAPAAKPVVPPGRALELLDTGDQQVKTVLQKVRRVIGRDIPILIHGETGVGKELLARAIHDDGPRHDKPFIAVNCAAIPEGLIESELFGYEEGAFTGAKRRGSCGKVLQAEGGTLFLDEIGDMPQPLQARLLRVLQERLVNPLGSTKSIPVDIHLVCATHRKLKDWVAAGKFREDLYYRLNGLTVNLPSLRARSDLPALINLILARLAPAGTEYRLAPEVMSMFLRHPWPGNIRQLSNLLRTATVMAGEDEVIGLEHLPDDFLDEFESTPAVAAPQVAAAAPVAPAAPLQPEAAVAPASAALANNANNLSGMILSASQNLESTTLSLIQRTLEMHQGNVSAAARQLGVSRNTLYRKLRQIWQL